MMKAGNLRAWVDRETLVEPETIVVESSDGTKVEAFLTLPSDEMLAVAGPVPLVVNPHGGPIGVRDRRVYDPFVAYLTSWGFAVLQVNYRGSSGYGREFEDAGKREWAQAIEDDIDAAVENVMARPEVDADRLCIVGGSYGGFSALASVVRHKSRYRCAATLNGVTDIPLMFETSDFADYEKLLEQFAVVAGDLEKNRSKLIDLSPAYNVAEMDVPIFVVFGTDDRRVDADHAHRLLLMMETHQKNHDVLEIREARHSFSSREWVVAVRALRRFLTRHLQPGLEVEPDPALEEPLFELLLKID
jgi:dipeptidyl aminopeptidase/acylaminoacyl peptidase